MKQGRKCELLTFWPWHSLARWQCYRISKLWHCGDVKLHSPYPNTFMSDGSKVPSARDAFFFSLDSGAYRIIKVGIWGHIIVIDPEIIFLELLKYN